MAGEEITMGANNSLRSGDQLWAELNEIESLLEDPMHPSS